MLKAYYRQETFLCDELKSCFLQCGVHYRKENVPKDRKGKFKLVQNMTLVIMLFE